MASAPLYPRSVDLESTVCFRSVLQEKVQPLPASPPLSRTCEMRQVAIQARNLSLSRQGRQIGQFLREPDRSISGPARRVRAVLDSLGKACAIASTSRSQPFGRGRDAQSRQAGRASCDQGIPHARHLFSCLKLRLWQARCLRSSIVGVGTGCIAPGRSATREVRLPKAETPVALERRR